MRKNDKGREDTLLVKMYGSNPSIQGQIHRFKRVGGLWRGRIREGGRRNENSLGKGNLAVGFESMLGTRIHGFELGAEIHGSEIPATSMPPRMSYYARPGTSEPRSVVPRRVTSVS